jgi:hypothetical protein
LFRKQSKVAPDRLKFPKIVIIPRVLPLGMTLWEPLNAVSIVLDYSCLLINFVLRSGLLSGFWLFGGLKLKVSVANGCITKVNNRQVEDSFELICCLIVHSIVRHDSGSHLLLQKCPMPWIIPASCWPWCRCWVDDPEGRCRSNSKSKVATDRLKIPMIVISPRVLPLGMTLWEPLNVVSIVLDYSCLFMTFVLRSIRACGCLHTQEDEGLSKSASRKGAKCLLSVNVIV